MQRAISAIPARCRRCGELFDISYDLEGVGQERLIMELMQAAKNPRTALCWECRSKKQKI